MRIRATYLIFAIWTAVACTSAWSDVTLREKIRFAAKRAYLDPLLVEAIVSVESNQRPEAVSKKGAMGLMQVMPRTADYCKIRNTFHPLDNLVGACQCFRDLINRYRGDTDLALAAYNAGPGNVERYGGIPPFKETQDYVRKVLAKFEALKSERRRP